MTDAVNAPKTLQEYAEDRAKLNTMKMPMLKNLEGSPIDHEHRVSQKVEYLLGMVGHLLKRVEALEAQFERRQS